MISIGEALVSQLEDRGIKCIFGIPGVHTVELYRGLATSGIRHITSRHEQGAAFMADGYARVSGKPGVAFVITGPGLTNALTAMAQSRADSVPTLVVSGVNALPTLGKGLGYLHEMPDQLAMARTVALVSERVESSEDLFPALEKVFSAFSVGRPGPTHIEVPMDVAGAEYISQPGVFTNPTYPVVDPKHLDEAAKLLNEAKKPVILVGGGARNATKLVRELAEKIDAPVVQTINARGIMHGHSLSVYASPSLQAVRDLITESDVVLAIGTELGSTDYDMYATHTMVPLSNLIRIDACPDQLKRQAVDLPLLGDAEQVLQALIKSMPVSGGTKQGGTRTEKTLKHAYEEIGPEMRDLSGLLEAMRDALPNTIMVGDSTQPINAGNLFYDHDRPSGWFNANTGFGSLGFGIPAAIGAAVADPTATVICIAGDGGAQFSLPELMVAKDENIRVIFVIWNNHGYREIETSMEAAGVTVVGCDPTPPDF